MKYLKCQYSKKGGPVALFSNECMIQFDMQPANYLKNLWNWMIVRKEDVIPITEDIGLVKLINVEKAKEGCVASIMDVGNHSISRRRVPKQSVFSL